MSVLPLPIPDRPVVRCANERCNRILRRPPINGLGPECAKAAGFEAPSAGRLRVARQAGPDLFDQYEEINEGDATMTTQIENPPATRTASVLHEIATERRAQLAKWGEQSHVSLDPVLLNRPGGCTPERMAEEYGIPSAAVAKQRCKARGHHAETPDTWAHILVEELAESVEAGVLYGDGPEMRGELIQTAAVIVAWVEAMDRRAASDAAR